MSSERTAANPDPQQTQTTTTPANDAWTVRKVLEWTTGHLKKHGSDTPRLDAEVLLAHARKCKRIELYTAYEEILSDSIRSTMRDLVQRRAQAEPVAYLVGHREFFSLNFRVTRDVLIPRPDTETLVIEIMDAVKSKNKSDSKVRVLDLCTGSGCVAIAVAKQCQAAKLEVEIAATDISPAALAIAKENAVTNKVDDLIQFYEGDLFASLPDRTTFDIVASNPPYIPTREIETLDPEVAKHEPRLALDGGPSGYEVFDRIIASTPVHANTDAWFLVEMSPEQETPLRDRLIAAGSFTDISVSKDLAGRARVLKARITPR